jgi:predicted RNase H-like HicB family nuclease
MHIVNVIYGVEDAVWWARSPAAEGWSAAADSLEELRVQISEGLEFFFDDPHVAVRMVDAATLPGNTYGADAVFVARDASQPTVASRGVRSAIASA